ncbi:proton channel OtopLc-like [Gigantopelta aegis]|uniref:proton channel OtopLc-like n=1 Tax=Gigantopelta aegis TaxID=1735272 RepID=UPI001B88CB44|nr:proton channel OtopLc-like [Gigantopelta aegis]
MDTLDTNVTPDIKDNDVGDGVKEQNKLDKETEQCASNVNTDVTPDPVLQGQQSGSGDASPTNAHAHQGTCVTSDNESDSCTDSDAFMNSQPNTDDTGSTSESEDTQIWVPVARQSGSGISGMGSTERSRYSSSPNPEDSSPDCSNNVRRKLINGTMSSNLTGDARSTVSEPTARVHYGPRGTSSQLSLPRKGNTNLGDVQGGTAGTLDTEFSAMMPGLPNGDSGIGPDGGSDNSPGFTDEVFLPDTPPPTPILKPQPNSQQPSKNSVQVNEHLLDSLFVNLSALYAMLLIILGAVIPVSETFTKERRPYLFQGFYIYLFAGSIFFLIFMYICVLRSRNCRWPCQKKRRNPLVNALYRKTLNRNFSFDDSPHSHTGSFYLRLGAVAFGIGSMIKNGLMFGDYFESNVSHFCDDVIYGIRPVVHLVFTFSQLYFVFLHSKVCVHRYKVISRFGFMHMVATNLCVWLGNIVEETLVEIRENKLVEKTSTPSPPRINLSVRLVKNTSRLAPPTTLAAPAQTTMSHHYDCSGESLMRSVVEESGPYLYPCSVEYSLICAGILYIMWKNIGRKGITQDQEELREAKSKAQRVSLDCTGSSRGLFLGILVLVAVVITVITFFVLVRSEGGNEAAIMLEHLSEIVIYIVTSLAVILAFYKMHALRFLPGKGMDLEQKLIILALAGIYVFSLLSIIAAAFIPGKTQSLLIIVSSVLRMFQATIQTVFILNSLHRCAHLKDQEKQKPGREFVTFLLMVNIAMWIINTFEVQQSEANPVQIDFYGILPWNIFTHISSPLAIFYRFHSTVCLSNIWKHAWKRKRA